MGERMKMVPVGGDLRHRRSARQDRGLRLAVAAHTILAAPSRTPSKPSGLPALRSTAPMFGERGAPGV